jgi:hypothetical protein
MNSLRYGNLLLFILVKEAGGEDGGVADNGLSDFLPKL